MATEHPSWAVQFKRPGTELRLIRGRYYLYEVSSKWNPVVTVGFGKVVKLNPPVLSQPRDLMFKPMTFRQTLYSQDRP